MKRIVCFLLMLIGVLGSEAGAQIVSDRACYGDTLEIILVNQMTGEPKVPLSIPLDAYPVVYAYKKGLKGETLASDPSRSCMKEPVLVSSVYFYPNSKPNKALGTDENGPLIRRFEIFYGTGFDASISQMREQQFKNLLAERKPRLLSNGFIKLYPTPSDSGEFRAPDSFDDPQGHHQIMQCNGFENRFAECDLNIFISTGVVVHYWFMTSSVRPEQWIATADLMRAVVARFTIHN